MKKKESFVRILFETRATSGGSESQRTRSKQVFATKTRLFEYKRLQERETRSDTIETRVRETRADTAASSSCTSSKPRAICRASVACAFQRQYIDVGPRLSIEKEWSEGRSDREALRRIERARARG